jgi:hypothetical protein
MHTSSKKSELKGVADKDSCDNPQACICSFFHYFEITVFPLLASSVFPETVLSVT